MHDNRIIARRRFLDVRLLPRAAWHLVRFVIPVTLLLYLYASSIEPYWMEASSVEVPIPGLPTALEGFTIVHISDVHMGKGPGGALLGKAVVESNAAGPDLVVLTGDYVAIDAHDELALHAGKLARELAGLHANHGVYAVLGNHDVWRGHGTLIAEALQSNGILVLRNQSAGVRVGEALLRIAGVDDAGLELCAGMDVLQSRYRTQTEALNGLMANDPEDGIWVLLVHNPQYTRLLPEGSVDLVLAGHTHGGYVNLPILHASLPPWCSHFEPVAGLIQFDGTQVYVNRGLGGVSLRFNARPEIAVLRLVSPQ